MDVETTKTAFESFLQQQLYSAPSLVVILYAGWRMLLSLQTRMERMEASEKDKDHKHDDCKNGVHIALNNLASELQAHKHKNQEEYHNMQTKILMDISDIKITLAKQEGAELVANKVAAAVSSALEKNKS